MPQKVFGFGIIGCGNISAIHSEAIKHIPEARLIAAADPCEERLAGFSKENNCDRYLDYRDLLKRGDVDIVTVCVPSSLHGQVTEEAARHGKHIIVEKPLDVTLERVDHIISICSTCNVKLSTVLQHRFDREVMAVKEIIGQGKLGKLFFGACHVKWYREQDYYMQSPWRGTWKYDGGGALMNQSIHYIDLLQYLMGPVEEVFGRCTTIGHPGLETEDLAVATVLFKNGALGLIEGTTVAYPGIGTFLDIYGEKGTVRIQDEKITQCLLKEGVFLYPLSREKSDGGANNSQGTGSARPMDISFEAHKRQFEDMIDALKNNREPLVNGVEARKAIEIILKVYRSSQTGMPVRFGNDNIYLRSEVV